MKKLLFLAFLSGVTLSASSFSSLRGVHKYPINATRSTGGRCIIKQCTITYDSNFEPSVDLVLKNQSAKVITQVILMFDFSDMSGWANTSVSRYLAEPFKTYTNLTVKIQPGQTTEGNLKIPLPQSKGKDKPSISIVKVRFEDGSIGD